MEKRASLIYAVMVKRGIVIPAYDELNTPSENEESPGSNQSDGTPGDEDKPTSGPDKSNSP